MDEVDQLVVPTVSIQEWNATELKINVWDWGHKYNTFLWIENSPVATRNAGHLPDKYYYSSVVWFDHWRGLVCIMVFVEYWAGALQLGARSPTCFCLCLYIYIWTTSGAIYIDMELEFSCIYANGIVRALFSPGALIFHRKETRF